MPRAPVRPRYRSPLRARQRERTREIILDALGAQVADRGLRSFSIPELARRAGVSVRTVYHHFPTRDALFDGVSDWVNRKLGNVQMPRTPEEVAQVAAVLFPRFDENAGIILAQLRAPAAEEAKLHARRGRARQFERALAEVTAGRPTDEARRVAAVFYLLASSSAWEFLREVWGFDGAEAARAVTWAQQLLLDRLKKDGRRSRP